MKIVGIIFIDLNWSLYLYFFHEGTEVGAKTVVGMEAETVRLESGVGRGWGKGSKHGGRVW